MSSPSSAVLTVSSVAAFPYIAQFSFIHISSATPRSVSHLLPPLPAPPPHTCDHRKRSPPAYCNHHIPAVGLVNYLAAPVPTPAPAPSPIGGERAAAGAPGQPGQDGGRRVAADRVGSGRRSDTQSVGLAGEDGVVRARGDARRRSSSRSGEARRVRVGSHVVGRTDWCCIEARANCGQWQFLRLILWWKQEMY